MYNGNKERLDLFIKIHSESVDKNGCFIWNGPVDNTLGYGRTSFIGESMTAHKAVYILAFGDYLKRINGRKTCIRHLCNNKLCINPKHLALGTYTDNNRDTSMTGRRVKMTKDKLILAIKLRKEGLTYREIGKEIGVNVVVASMSLRGKTYYCSEMLKEINNQQLTSH